MSATRPRTYPLRYVCFACGALVASFPDCRTDRPAVLSVCDRSSCRAIAARRYRFGGEAA